MWTIIAALICGVLFETKELKENYTRENQTIGLHRTCTWAISLYWSAYTFLGYCWVNDSSPYNISKYYKLVIKQFEKFAHCSCCCEFKDQYMVNVANGKCSDVVTDTVVCVFTPHTACRSAALMAGKVTYVN